MNLLCCESCGSVVRTEEIRGWCKVCGKRTCIACARVCDECLQIVCQNCISNREIWRDSTHYFRKVCKHCDR